MRTARGITPLDRVLRAEGRSGRWLADQIGVHEAQVSRWRRGLHVPEQRTRLRIARALGRTPDELFGAEEDVAAAA